MGSEKYPCYSLFQESIAEGLLIVIVYYKCTGQVTYTTLCQNTNIVGATSSTTSYDIIAFQCARNKC